MLLEVRSSGEAALRLVTKRYPLRVVGFLDADNAKKNMCIRSVPVRGSLKYLDQLVQRCNIRAVLLISSATQDERIHLRAKCRKLGIGLIRIRFELEDLVSRSGFFWEDFVPQEHLVELTSHDAENLSRQGAPLRARLGQAGTEFALERFSKDRLVDDLESLYQKLTHPELRREPAPSYQRVSPHSPDPPRNR